MKLLFTLDTKNYDLNGTVVNRPSVRSIIIKDDKVAMVHSLKYNYYKFPGGGIEKDESLIDALIRETLEETGLNIIKTSIKEYGYVHRIQKGDYEDVFIQDNFYYLCEVEDQINKQDLDDYEEEEQFTLKYLHPSTAIEANRKTHYDPIMAEREIKVLELLIKDGLLTRK